ncbi:H-2 class I histocompatibility antigen, D-D alpha chain isoform X2 [Ictalurus punctatus]|uniref:H-2 class I histocompatibility antigen, D-D alpha chain isoform X2 n=1 Tax=Ictalurus punctatus TaxID=7998 RepID=A0A9F7TKJ1_ICTPU|nr:H-2 class I histocompatibility antigen, D-D alpha chain isoform X2 [Ictalurus punctatus]
MKERKTLFILLFFLHPVQLFGDDVHSISGFFISSQGLSLPNYMERITVNDVTIFYHDSGKNIIAPCPKWLNTTTGQQHWENIRVISQHNKQMIATAIESAIQQFNLTGSHADINIYQGYSRCDLYPNGTMKASLAHAFNGKDFLSLDFDKPKVRLFERQRAGSTLLTCHVTGFYPRAVQVKWIGADLQLVDDEMNDVLPNGDGTFQTRSSVIRPEENTGDQRYSCVVHHSSLEGNITVTWGKEEKPFRLYVWITLGCVFIVTVVGLVIRCILKSKDAGI